MIIFILCNGGISKFLHYVNGLTFEEEPNYNHCKKLLKDDFKSVGGANDNVLEFTKAKKKPSKTPAVPVNAPVPLVSDKENSKQKATRKTQTKRKVPEEIKFEEGMVLTPAMQEILNKKQSESKGQKTKSRKK